RTSVDQHEQLEVRERLRKTALDRLAQRVRARVGRHDQAQPRRSHKPIIQLRAPENAEHAEHAENAEETGTAVAISSAYSAYSVCSAFSGLSSVDLGVATSYKLGLVRRYSVPALTLLFALLGPAHLSAAAADASSEVARAKTF